jgi:hypothetical protein
VDALRTPLALAVLITLTAAAHAQPSAQPPAPPPPAPPELPGFRAELVAGAGFNVGIGDFLPLCPRGLGVRALVTTLPGTQDVELGADWREIGCAHLDGFDFTQVSDSDYDRLRFTIGYRFRGNKAARAGHRYVRLAAGFELHDIELVTVYDDGGFDSPSYETQRASAKAGVVMFAYGTTASGRFAPGIEIEFALGAGSSEESTFAHEPDGPFGEIQLQVTLGGEVW